MLYVLLDWSREWLERLGAYSYLQVLDRLEFRAMSAALLAFAIVLVFGERVIAFLRRKKIGDAGLTDAAALQQTAGSKRHVPTMGGVLIVGAILAGTLLLADVRNFYVVLGLTVTLWMAVIGGIDDWLKLTAASRPGASRQGLYAWEKLVAQLGGAALISAFAFTHGQTDAVPNLAHVLNLPFQKTFEQEVAEGGGVRYIVNPALWYLGLGSFVLIGTLMITGMSNAVNITDGMDGLAAGTTAAVSLGLLVLTVIAGWASASQYLLVPHVPGSGELSVMAGSMAGACLGFLWFNCLPASVFMGDTGSLALGGLLGYIAVVIRQEVVLLFMSAVFLAEIGSVVLQVGYFRATGGKRIFRCAPFHHHLHLGGWTESKVVARLWIVTVLLVVIGLASIKVR
jgi:phospho-N-acetylmuramoyl-pentapeptide-transferase